MPLQLISRDYGAAYAGSKVLIRTTDAASPARIYAKATGGLLSASGTINLASLTNHTFILCERRSLK